MRTPALTVNVRAVRIRIDDIRSGAERVKYILCDGGGASVGTVKADAVVLEAAGGQRNQMADVAVAPGNIVDGAPDAVAGGQRKP